MKNRAEVRVGKTDRRPWPELGVHAFSAEFPQRLFALLGAEPHGGCGNLQGLQLVVGETHVGELVVVAIHPIGGLTCLSTAEGDHVNGDTEIAKV